MLSNKNKSLHDFAFLQITNISTLRLFIRNTSIRNSIRVARKIKKTPVYLLLKSQDKKLNICEDIADVVMKGMTS